MALHVHQLSRYGRGWVFMCGFLHKNVYLITLLYLIVCSIRPIVFTHCLLFELPQYFPVFCSFVILPQKEVFGVSVLFRKPSVFPRHLFKYYMIYTHFDYQSVFYPIYQSTRCWVAKGATIDFQGGPGFSSELSRQGQNIFFQSIMVFFLKY